MGAVGNNVDRSFDVGQILYVLMYGDHIVLPVRVVEEITKKTVAGISKTYVVTTGIDNKTHMLDDIEGIPYLDLGTLREALITNATHAIDTIIDRVKTASITKFEMAVASKPA